jgi:hypothetical protein
MTLETLQGVSFTFEEVARGERLWEGQAMGAYGLVDSPAGLMDPNRPPCIEDAIE